MVRDHEKIMKCMLQLSILLLFNNIESLCNSLNKVLFLVLRHLYSVFSAFISLSSCLFVFCSDFGIEAILAGRRV